MDRNGKLIVPSVAVGDKVMLPSFGGIPLKVGDEVRLSSLTLPASSLRFADVIDWNYVM